MPAAAQPSRFEERPRPERRDRRERRDREYRPEDAVASPEGGIDNTMAAAFAESGLLEQFRASQAARETDDPAAAAPPVVDAGEVGVPAASGEAADSVVEASSSAPSVESTGGARDQEGTIADGDSTDASAPAVDAPPEAEAAADVADPPQDAEAPPGPGEEPESLLGGDRADDDASGERPA